MEFITLKKTDIVRFSHFQNLINSIGFTGHDLEVKIFLRIYLKLEHNTAFFLI